MYVVESRIMKTEFSYTIGVGTIEAIVAYFIHHCTTFEGLFIGVGDMEANGSKPFRILGPFEQFYPTVALLYTQLLLHALSTPSYFFYEHAGIVCNFLTLCSYHVF